MIFDGCGKPVRDIEPIIKEMCNTGVDYKVVSKEKIKGFGYGNTRFYPVDLKFGGEWHRISYMVDKGIEISESVPKKFRPVIAAHEYGHKNGLTHREIWQLELAMAEKLAKETNDLDLKLDYVRWSSSSNELFKEMTGNVGKEQEQELMDYHENQYRAIIEMQGTEGIFVTEKENLMQIY
jgi:hypothetical protein